MTDVQISFEQYSNIALDVKRCLSVLYGTRIGTVALDRDFGLDWSFLDLPIEAAKAACAAEIISKTAKYEPRAKIARVTFEGSNTGQFIPRVEVALNNV